MTEADRPDGANDGGEKSEPTQKVVESERRKGLERRTGENRRISSETVGPNRRSEDERRRPKDRRNLAAEILLPGVLRKDDD